MRRPSNNPSQEADYHSQPMRLFTFFFGQLKPYKNLDGLIKVFRETAPSDALLLVAGKFSDDQYRAKILRMAEGDSRIRVDANFIPDEWVSVYVSASNAMCIPYREILTSGTAMLSLSFGKPVISIDRGFLRDVITERTGILIQPGDERSLAKALHEVRRRHWSEEEIRLHAKCFTFNQAASIFIAQLPSV